ncbi:MAG: TonB-dependent receptor [Calditrichia bacterium]
MVPRKHLNIIFFFLLACETVLAQTSPKTGAITGNIIDAATAAGLEGAFIKVAGIDSTHLSGKNGFYYIKNIPAGSATLVVEAAGFGRTVVLDIPIIPGEVIYRDIYLQKTTREGESFYIGGIEVTAERELLPDKPATTTKISSGEIEHLQASSLGDVLELIPGQKFTNPGLESVKQIRLRQTATEDEAERNAALGTQIILDGVPLSNNANMQLDTRINTATETRVTVNSQIDLRQIPAENISSVEVIRGIPPAKFGDLGSGAVLVHTNNRRTPLRAKSKYNPRNKELNLSGGWQLGKQQLSFNANYAHSLRNIRVPGDAYTRIAGQLNHLFVSASENMEISNRFYFTRTFDEQGLREGDLFFTERYNRNYTLRYNNRSTLHLKDKKRIEGIFSVNMDRQNTHYKSLVSRDTRAISDRMTPGTQEGYFVSSYMTELRVKSRGWNLFGQLEYANQSRTGNILHDWQAGLNLRHEFNNGEGRQFDPRYPPTNDENQGDRPRSYRNLPGLTQLTLYFQDEIVGRLWKDFNLQLGLRYDIFGPTDFDASDLFKFKSPVESHHGDFLSPRINFVYHLGANTQMRLGFGRTAKAPPLSMIYPNPLYFDIVDSMYYHPDSVEQRLAIVSTYIYENEYKSLKAFTQDKFEASLDRRWGPLGITVTGFYERLHNGFELNGFIPAPFVKYSFPEWPSPSPKSPRDTILLDYRRPINSVESISKGLELALTSKRIPAISTLIRIDAAYHFTKSWWQDNHFEIASNLRFDNYLNQNVRPFWKRNGSWSDELVIHYRFDTVARNLGLWFTVAVQQIALERDKYLSLEDSLAWGYYLEDGTRVDIPENKRNADIYKGIRRPAPEYQFITESKPNLWLVNLRVSKSLWPGSEVSFFVNNLFNSRPLYQRKRVASGSTVYIRRNPEIFYGMEFSMVVDDFYRFMKRY